MAVHKLIIAEKPSVAEAIAHTVGARDKVYAKESKNFCYEGNGYYVANAAGHLYCVGKPEDYGYKEWNIDTLPFFPELSVHETEYAYTAYGKGGRFRNNLCNRCRT